MNDPIADMFIRIKNAQAVRQDVVTVPASHVKENIAKVLQNNGFISSVTRVANAAGRDVLELGLVYEGKTPALRHLRRVSKPGLRRYSSSAKFPRPLSGHGLVIVSTTKGIMSGMDAQKQGLGGEVIGVAW
jgi:small subunit ribosomal protein S8